MFSVVPCIELSGLPSRYFMPHDKNVLAVGCRVTRGFRRNLFVNATAKLGQFEYLRFPAVFGLGVVLFPYALVSLLFQHTQTFEVVQGEVLGVSR